ncbi:MAG: DUF5379 domain-containing protein [Methanobacteriaceae archaeon]|jgi:hypothetical protein|nr:DUF5379 domain-containing protein [Candidatus Methanorudis spinitermitis]
MDNAVKITSVHIVAALIAGYLSSLFTLGQIPGLGSNDVLAAAVGLAILYIVGQLCDKLFGKQEGFSKWLWNGIVPFAFVWFVFWTIITNYSGILY